MRVKLDRITLELDTTTLYIGFLDDPITRARCVFWVFNEYCPDELNGSMAIDKLLTPDSIDQLAYDIYRVLARIEGPSLVAAWDAMWDDRLQREYLEYSRVRVALDWIVTSHR